MAACSDQPGHPALAAGADVCIGLMTRNEQDFVGEALASLARQTNGSFRLLIADDASEDRTGEICRAFAAGDDRVTYFRHPARIGMAANYHSLFCRRPPDTRYFAWAAGHDVYHPRWLEALMQVIGQDPGTVCAYSDSVSIDRAGNSIPRKPKSWRHFDSGNQGEWERVASITEAKHFGRMIYGLFRARAVERAGGMPRLLAPDVLFLWRLACYGDIRFVPLPYYYRRETKGRMSRSAMMARQRRNLFVVPELRHRLPPALYNSYYLLRAPLEDLPESLQGQEARIRRTFAKRYLLRSLRKNRIWRLAARTAMAMRKARDLAGGTVPGSRRR